MKNTSTTLTNQSVSKSYIKQMVVDIKALLKGLVLLSNVLPVLTGLVLAMQFTGANMTDNLAIIVLTLLGSILLMAGALVLNNWFDADIDTMMQRTKHRPTVTGNFSLRTVFRTGVVLSILGFSLLAFTTLETTIYGFIGWFTYVILYTIWTKRKYTWNTIVGSISGAVTPLIGWSAIAPTLDVIPIAMALILFVWQMPHTYAIAIKKREEYKLAGVKMLPVIHGIRVAKNHIVFYIASLIPVSFLFYSLGLPFMIFAILMAVTGLVLTSVGFYSSNEKKWANRIFLFSVNYIMFLFIGMMFATI
ncbi:protoheme IX farnesyltransferase 2 [Paraliobacillus quinghaiensis]|uniref:Protoheme IX farnesyltransferase n=1 Tax=Paraliobacillus quinghaiensis TaxID=470815 RepID=A0A917WWV9_9BACI|nr:heme o synthase [Paraliobacillus quinghaiensis]GGM37287.1 protoheme IX farnesyltransferase 2 [Paraliobacillus quinghaiensis]